MVKVSYSIAEYRGFLPQVILRLSNICQAPFFSKVHSSWSQSNPANTFFPFFSSLSEYNPGPPLPCSRSNPAARNASPILNNSSCSIWQAVKLRKRHNIWSMITRTSSIIGKILMCRITTIAQNQSKLLTLLWPLEPKQQHREIQERHVDDVPEWLAPVEELRRSCESSTEAEGDKLVTFF